MGEITCQYVSDEDGELGIESEEWDDRGGLSCTAEAEHTLRPKGGWHIREFGNRVPFCDSHAKYLVDEAKATWEVIEWNDLEQIKERTDY